MGCLTAGIIPVAIQHTRTSYEIKKILKHSRSTVLFVIGNKQFMKIKEEQISSLERIILLDFARPGSQDQSNGKMQVMGWRDFVKQSGKLERGSCLLTERMNKLRGDQLAVITYSSAQLRKSRNGYAQILYIPN